MTTASNPIALYATALRVYQWPKNLVIFAALVFAQQLTDPAQVRRSIIAFVLLCAASSAVYLFNDLLDIEKDRAHPEKRHRPIASGAIAPWTAVVVLVVLAGGAMIGAYAIHPPYLWAILLYTALNVAYTLLLKRIMLIDVLAIALGFVIRAIAGAVILEVTVSNWLVVCTLFLALFLSFGKRRHEVGLLEAEAIHHREVLGHYNVPYLDSLMIVLAASTLLTYTIYTCSPEVVQKFHTDKLYLTLPFVVYGLFRYLYLVHHRRGGGDPSSTLLKDVPILATVLLWGLTCIGILYGAHLR